MITGSDAQQGLTSSEAAGRLLRDGANTFPTPRRPSPLRRLLGELVHFFAVMLWVAAALALVARLPELAIAIAAVIILNAAFATVQQARADRAADRLQELLPATVTVKRDGGRHVIEAGDVVIEDLLLLESGDHVPADAQVLAQDRLLIDSSILTGESEAGSAAVGEQIFAGTFVVEGECQALVTAVGRNTRLAGIAHLTASTEKPDTPLTRALRGVVRLTAAIAIAVGALFLAISVLIGSSIQDGFIFAIGVAVALVPEALLPTVTLSLAHSSELMAKRQVLVRNLEAVETLGSTTFICTDKTGTLTRNQMSVVEVWVHDGTLTAVGGGYGPLAELAWSSDKPRRTVGLLALAAVRCSTGYVVEQNNDWVAHGDPMEAALDALARRLGIDTETDRLTDTVVRRFSFDPLLRRMAVVRADELIVKGAPDAVLPLCDNSTQASAAVETLTARGLRVLAVASAPYDGPIPDRQEDLGRRLHLLGLVALDDPPRPEVARSITLCRRAGVKVAMITGDHPRTARAIADEVGLRTSDAPVLLGADLPVDEQHLGAVLDRDGVVVARVSPEDKLRIARALRLRGHVVAMTGDGVNDAPALHEADIGVAMGRSGTDVAREAADLVLLDDSFASIVAGVEQGRASYINVRRFLTYHLTDNVAELAPFLVWALSGGQFPLALGVLQILALDLGTDTFSAVALGAEPPAKHLLDGPPVQGRLMNGTVLRRAFGVLGPLEALLSLTAFLLSMAAFGWLPGQSFPSGDELMAASGAAFITVVFAQSANAFACRSSTRWPGALGWTSNRLLLGAVATGLAVSLLMLWIPPVATVLGQASPPAAGWIVAVAAIPTLLAVDALEKWLSSRSSRSTPPATTASSE